MAVLFFIVVVIVVCYLLRGDKSPPADNPPLDKTCLSCGQAACEIIESVSGVGIPYHRVKCSACRQFNIEYLPRSTRQHTINVNNKIIAEQQQKKQNLLALLREAAQQGVNPETFDQWLRSKGL
jgi:hypothetical protein